MMMISFSNYSSFVGFGDSLVDSGNVGILLGSFSVTPASGGYVENRFSNGPNFFDQIFGAITENDPLAYRPSLDFAANGSLGLNYAFGGAEADGDLVLQVQGFSADLASGRVLGGEVGADALFGINIGGNDAFAFLDANAEEGFTDADVAAFAATYTSNITASVSTLEGLGVLNLLVAGMPNVGLAPTVSNEMFGGDIAVSLAAIQPLTDAVNAVLFDALLDIRVANPDFEIFAFELDFSPIVADPAAFGLDPALLTTPFSLALAAGDATLEDIGSYAFIDGTHPTAAIQTEFFGAASAAFLIGSLTSDGADIIVGGRGGDTIEGFGGADAIYGGSGADMLFGDSQTDILTDLGMMLG